MVFFIASIYVAICQFCSFTFPVLFTKNNKLWNERKEDFFLYIAASAYHAIPSVVEDYIFIHNRIFRHTCMYKQFILTK